MSLKYIDKNGAVTVLAGLTPGGNLETGAVATRSGSFSVPALSAEQETSVIPITFSEPMPDADYLVSFVNTSTRTLIGGPSTKTENGFSVYVKNVSASSESAYTIQYTAYKLYEVANAEALYSTVQDLEAMVPSNASSTNKFTTADDLRTETRTLDRRLDDVEDVIPTSASITNKLVTQNDLSGVEIDKVEDINDVELTNIQDGQTLIWDDTNSKWVNGQGGKVYTAGDGISISNTDEISAKIDDTSITTDTNDALKVADTYKTIFVGTRAQWDALSATDKIKYQEAHITDDVIGGEVADEVTDGLMSPVTSNAVFDALDTLSNKLQISVINNTSTPTSQPVTVTTGSWVSSQTVNIEEPGWYFCHFRCHYYFSESGVTPAYGREISLGIQAPNSMIYGSLETTSSSNSTYSMVHAYGLVHVSQANSTIGVRLYAPSNLGVSSIKAYFQTQVLKMNTLS